MISCVFSSKIVKKPFDLFTRNHQPGSNMMSVSGQRPISADCSMKHANSFNYLVPVEDVAVKEMRTATQQWSLKCTDARFEPNKIEAACPTMQHTCIAVYKSSINVSCMTLSEFSRSLDQRVCVVWADTYWLLRHYVCSGLHQCLQRNYTRSTPRGKTRQYAVEMIQNIVPLILISNFSTSEEIGRSTIDFLSVVSVYLHFVRF